MSRYLFIFGTAPELSYTELVQVLKHFSYSYSIIEKNSEAVLCETQTEWNVSELQNRLGGTVKIGRIVEAATEDVLQLKHACRKHLKDVKQFGISLYSFGSLNILKDLVSSIKKDYFPNSRYKIPKEGTFLPAAVHKQEITELAVVCFNNKFYIARIESVQDVDDWSQRDRGRPRADAKSGMLPLKIARIMVNMAIHENAGTIADPFCGMGSVLSEALMVGVDVVGSDSDQLAVRKTEENLNWLKTKYPQLSRRLIRLVNCDATHISEKLSSESLDAIVTEPFLGAPFEKRGNTYIQKGQPVSMESLSNTMRGLVKLYRGALKDWHKILKPNSRIVIIAPVIIWESRIFSVKKVFDNCETLGYTLDIGPLEYSRPQAIVKRRIYVLTKLN